MTVCVHWFSQLYLYGGQEISCGLIVFVGAIDFSASVRYSNIKPIDLSLCPLPSFKIVSRGNVSGPRSSSSLHRPQKDVLPPSSKMQDAANISVYQACVHLCRLIFRVSRSFTVYEVNTCSRQVDIVQFFFPTIFLYDSSSSHFSTCSVSAFLSVIPSFISSPTCDTILLTHFAKMHRAAFCRAPHD